VRGEILSFSETADEIRGEARSRFGGQVVTGTDVASIGSERSSVKSEDD
jgi:hypothetical protein